MTEIIAIIIVGVVSAALIIHLWFWRKQVPFWRKLSWSFVLLFPLVGWLFYISFFNMPPENEHKAPYTPMGGFS